MFRRFNRRYFGSALAGWRVQYGNRPGGPTDGSVRFQFSEAALARTEGYTDRATRIIFLRFGLTEPALSATLLHEMIHATGVRWHGAAFLAECRRLQALGAPGTETDALLGHRETLKAIRTTRTERRRAWRAAGSSGLAASGVEGPSACR
jgi:hypothetical protein